MCSIETYAVFLDFGHFQPGSVDLVLIAETWGETLCLGQVMLDIRRGSKEIHVLYLSKNQTLKSVTLCSGPNCLGVSHAPHSLTSTITSASVIL